jgi:hypothetical protein
MRRRHFCLAAAALALTAPGAAQAAPPHEITDSTTNAGAAVPAHAASGKKLPFSGLDLALLTAGGGPLLLIGVSLRRRHAAPSVQPAKEDSLTLASG